MKKEDIHLDDIKRILIGNVPPEFLIEVFFRTLFTYLIFLWLVKFLGKRMSGQLTLTEMAMMISMGAIIGSPMQIPDRGVVTALVILVMALVFQRAVNNLSFQREWLEQLTQGSVNVMVKEGIIQLDQMKHERVSQVQLLAALRDQKVSHLGEVKRVYLESNGVFSVYRSASVRPGLSTLPQQDLHLVYEQSTTGELTFACSQCGSLSSSAAMPCPTCHYTTWTNAIH